MQKDTVPSILALAVMISLDNNQQIGPILGIQAAAIGESNIVVDSFNGFTPKTHPRDNSLNSPPMEVKDEQVLVDRFQEFLLKQQKALAEGQTLQMLFVHGSSAELLFKRMKDNNVITDGQVRMYQGQSHDVTGEVIQKIGCSTKLSIADYAASNGIKSANTLSAELLQIFAVYQHIQQSKNRSPVASSTPGKRTATA